MAVQSPTGKSCFVYLVEARTRKNAKPGTKPRYSVLQVYPAGTEFPNLQALAKKAALKKFPNGIPKGLKSPFKTGEELRNDETGKLPDGIEPTDICIEFWRYEKDGQPPVVGPDKAPIAPGRPYSGCQGQVLANASAYSNEGNKGVSFHLEAYRFIADGEPCGGSAPCDPEAEFSDIEGVETATAAAPDVDDLW
jgi:hypothetical protein